MLPDILLTALVLTILGKTYCPGVYEFGAKTLLDKWVAKIFLTAFSCVICSLLMKKGL